MPTRHFGRLRQRLVAEMIITVVIPGVKGMGEPSCHLVTAAADPVAADIGRVPLCLLTFVCCRPQVRVRLFFKRVGYRFRCGPDICYSCLRAPTSTGDAPFLFFIFWLFSTPSLFSLSWWPARTRVELPAEAAAARFRRAETLTAENDRQTFHYFWTGYGLHCIEGQPACLFPT